MLIYQDLTFVLRKAVVNGLKANSFISYKIYISFLFGIPLNVGRLNLMGLLEYSYYQQDPQLRPRSKNDGAAGALPLFVLSPPEFS